MKTPFHLKLTTVPWVRGSIRCPPLRRVFLFVPLLLACLALSPAAQAVVPPPDGGYRGGNTAEGNNALSSLTTGQYNTAVGLNSLSSTTTGTFNTAIGSAALRNNTTSDSNTAVGSNALFRNRFGDNNTAVGDSALYYNTVGDLNTAVGDLAMYYNTIGQSNTAVGDGALLRNIEGGYNTALGSSALNFNTTGYNNTAVGDGALYGNTTSSGNTALGRRAGIDVTMADNVICIGAPGANVSDSCYIGNVWQQPGGSQAVYVNALGKLGVQVSSRRFKDEIKAMEETSEVIYRLKPVSFRYKPEIEPTRPPGFGLIAEDVEKINPDLVVRDKEGKPYSVRYDAVNAMLLNEFLKEHRKVQAQQRKIHEQEATVAELKSTVAEQRKDFEAISAQQHKEIQALTASLNEQASQIQKVSAQIEIGKFTTGRIHRGGPAPQMVLNNQ